MLLPAEVQEGIELPLKSHLSKTLQKCLPATQLRMADTPENPVESILHTADDWRNMESCWRLPAQSEGNSFKKHERPVQWVALRQYVSKSWNPKEELTSTRLVRTPENRAGNHGSPLKVCS